MAPEKTFDKADLVKFFNEVGQPASIGAATVIHPAPTLFGATETKRYPAEAQTIGLWCEKYGLAFLIQRVMWIDGGRDYVAPDQEHPLRERRTLVRYGDGGSSAQLVRWAAELADAYREEMRVWMPAAAVDLTKRIGDGSIVEDLGYGTVHLAPGDAQEAGEPEPEPEPEPAPTVDDPDSTPTGTTIDDVFAEHDGDSDEGATA